MLPRLEAAIESLEKAIKNPDQKHVSLTDPDAQMMAEGRNKRIAECHSLEVAVDSGLIVCARTSQTGPDAGRLMGLIEAAKEHEPDGISHVTADSGYFGTDNIVALEESGIHTCIPDGMTACDLRKGLPSGSTKLSVMSAVEMVFDPENNCFLCPEGNILKFNQKIKSDGQTVSFYKAKRECTGCPIREQCMTNVTAKRRVLKVGEHRDQIKELLERFNSREQQQMYHDRGKNVETKFAFCRVQLGFTRWLLRGKEKIAAEGALVASACQIRKLHTAIRALA